VWHAHRHPPAAGVRIVSSTDHRRDRSRPQTVTAVQRGAQHRYKSSSSSYFFEITQQTCMKKHVQLESTNVNHKVERYQLIINERLKTSSLHCGMTTIVAIPQIVTNYLLDGRSGFRQCDGKCIFWNNEVPDLFKSSLRVTMSLEKLHLLARFNKASILPALAADANTPQADRAYSKRDTIRPVKTIFNWSVESPWLRSKRNK